MNDDRAIFEEGHPIARRGAAGESDHILLSAWDHPIDKKLSMSRPCATLGGEPLRS